MLLPSLTVPTLGPIESPNHLLTSHAHLHLTSWTSSESNVHFQDIIWGCRKLRLSYEKDFLGFTVLLKSSEICLHLMEIWHMIIPTMTLMNSRWWSFKDLQQKIHQTLVYVDPKNKALRKNWSPFANCPGSLENFVFLRTIHLPQWLPYSTRSFLRQTSSAAYGHTPQLLQSSNRYTTQG